MTDPLPFEIEEDGRVTRFVLPTRKLGELRRYAWIPIIFGGCGVLFMLFWIGTPLSWGIRALMNGDWFGLLLVGFSMLGLMGLRMTLLIIAGGIAVLNETSRCVVEIRNGKLYGNEKFGWITWRRKIKIATITKLAVSAAMKSGRRSNNTINLAPRLSKLESLSALGTGKPFPVAAAYPRDVLLPLANELVERLSRDYGDIDWSAPADFTESDEVVGSIATKPKIELEVAEKGEPLPVSQPAESTIVKQVRDDSTAFEIPPAGIWRGSNGLMFFALLWNGFMVVFTLGVIFGEKDPDAEGSFLVMYLVIALFFAVGIGLALFAVNLGTRSVMIGVLGDMLFVERKSIFGKQWQQFLRSELNSIDVGPSGVEVNDRPIYELQIHPSTGKKIGLLSQRTDGELHWLAYELTTLLDLASDADASDDWQRCLDDKGNPISPASGSIAVSETVGGKEIVVPAIGMWKQSGLALFGIAFALIGVGIACYPLIIALWNGKPIGPEFAAIMNHLGAVAFGFVFAAVGVGVLIVSLVIGTRRFRIAASSSRLTVQRYGVLSRKTLEWEASQLTSVDRQRSSTTVNQQVLDELQIVSSDGNGLTLMTGRPRDEIDFVAAHINVTLERRA